MTSTKIKKITVEITKRNKSTFERLFFEYSEGLVRFAEGYLFNRQEAEDVVQNLFLHLWEHADKIKINRSIKSYLYQSTRNRCLNIIRNLKVQDKRDLLFLEAMLNSQNEISSFDEELYGKVEAAMSKLPKKMLQIFKLKYLEGKKISEIAESLQVAETTIKTQLQRAKKKIDKSFLT